MFNPGETVIHQFIIPFKASELATVIVSYKQGDDIVVEKTITSGFEEIEENTKALVNVTFSQRESLLFKDLHNVSIQINVVNTLGTRATSKLIKSYTGPQYHREVISP